MLLCPFLYDRALLYTLYQQISFPTFYGTVDGASAVSANELETLEDVENCFVVPLLQALVSSVKFCVFHSFFVLGVSI